MKAPDRYDIARLALAQVLANPVTWAPFVPVAAAYAFIGVPWWLCLPLLAVVIVVMFGAWARRWPYMMNRARTELLTAHRAMENAELAGRIKQLAQRHSAGPVLDALRDAMGIKQAVEDRIAADHLITEHEEEVGAMVGDLVRTMVSEAERLTLTKGGEVSRFDRAAGTLRRAYADIDVILDPVPEDLRLAAEDDALARASERLGEKLEQARGIRRHLERGMIQRDTEEPPPSPPTLAE